MLTPFTTKSHCSTPTQLLLKTHSLKHAARRPLLAAFHQIFNAAHHQVRAEVQVGTETLRTVKAGMLIIQNIALLLDCSLREAANDWLEEALRPGEALLDSHERSLEDRLCRLVAYLTAFFRLTQAGHLPDAVLRAVAKDLRLNHDCFNCPNPLPIFEAAVERRRVGRRRSGRFVVRA